MRRLGKALRLSSKDHLLLIEAASVVAAVRVGLWLLPFRVLNRITTGWAKERRATYQADAARVGWSIRNASRCIPAASCLTQALAAKVLLGRRGIEAKVHIGVSRSNDQFEAHAWVTSAGHIVVGGRGAEKFTPLLVLENSAVKPCQ